MSAKNAVHGSSHRFVLSHDNGVTESESRDDIHPYAASHFMRLPAVRLERPMTVGRQYQSVPIIGHRHRFLLALQRILGVIFSTTA